jgi:polysaccharide biosynthesis transport protein
MRRHPLVAASLSPPELYASAYEAKRSGKAPYILRILTRIRTHWRLFAGVFFACVALATVGTLLVPKQYTATVKMIVANSPIATDAEQSNPSLTADTIADLIQDASVAQTVIDTLKLHRSRAQLLSHIAVKELPKTPIISLSATWASPEQAASIANEFAAVFINRDRELVGAQAVSAQTYLQNALSKAQTALQQANSALSSDQAKSRVEDLQDDLEQAQAQVASTQAQMAAMPPTIVGQQATDANPASTALQQQLSETELQLATARQRYTDKHPTVVALEQQRDQLERQLAAQPVTVTGQVISVPNPAYQQLSQQMETLRSRITSDSAQIAQLNRRGTLAPVSSQKSQSAQSGLPEERAKLASDVYNALEQKYDDATVAASSAISNLTVAQPAESDNVKVSPNLVVNVIASVVIGIILGLLAVAIANATQRRIREDGDVERALGLPVIAHIPSLTEQHRRALPWLQTMTVEAFLHICASLQILGRKSGTSVIVITSPEKGDGKTTITYHVASAMSRVRSRVLLIDADMRSPATHLHAKIKNGPGLSDVLRGRRSFDQVVVHHTATLDVLTAGALPINPVALAESTPLDDLLVLARERYDCVIIDTPALSPFVDAGLIAMRADSTALVVSAKNSDERAAARAVARLRALGIDNILGVIMNRTGTKFTDYGRYSDYLISTSPALPHPGAP